MSDKQAIQEISSLSYEDALAQLEDIVAELEKGDVPLAKSIQAYERGEALRQHCALLLRQAEARIEKLKLAADGRVEGVEPFESGQQTPL